MPTVAFRGRVVPTAHQIKISKPLVAHVNGPAGKHTYTINVEGTTMLVTCDMPHFVQEELPSLMQRAQIFGQTVLNVFSFFTTTVYRYMIEEAQLPNSSWHGIVYGCGVAQGVCTVGRLVQ
jgi:hypothetical protein